MPGGKPPCTHVGSADTLLGEGSRSMHSGSFQGLGSLDTRLGFHMGRRRRSTFAIRYVERIMYPRCSEHRAHCRLISFSFSSCFPPGFDFSIAHLFECTNSSGLNLGRV